MLDKYLLLDDLDLILPFVELLPSSFVLVFVLVLYLLMLFKQWLVLFLILWLCRGNWLHCCLWGWERTGRLDMSGGWLRISFKIALNYLLRWYGNINNFHRLLLNIGIAMVVLHIISITGIIAIIINLSYRWLLKLKRVVVSMWLYVRVEVPFTSWGLIGIGVVGSVFRLLLSW